MTKTAAVRRPQLARGGLSRSIRRRFLPPLLVLAVVAALLPAPAAQAGPAGPPKGITITFLDGPVAENGSLVRVLFDANGQTHVTGFRYDPEDYDKFRYAVAADVPGGTAIVNLRADHVGTLRVGVGNQDTAGDQYGIAYYAEIPVVGDPSISGLVTEEGFGRPEVTVTLQPGGQTTVTDAEGYFRFDHLSPGEYSISVSHGRGCGLYGETLGIHVPEQFGANVWGRSRSDAAGYRCIAYESLRRSYEQGDTILGLAGDNAYQEVALPFAFNFYGQDYSSAWVDTNGYLTFDDPGASLPTAPADFPLGLSSSRVIAPYWDDLIVDAESTLRTRFTTDEWGFQTLVIDWHNVARAADPDKRFNFNAVLASAGIIYFAYQGLDSMLAANATATVGVDGPTEGLGGCYDQLTEPLADARIIDFSKGWANVGNLTC